MFLARSSVEARLLGKLSGGGSPYGREQFAVNTTLLVVNADDRNCSCAYCGKVTMSGAVQTGSDLTLRSDWRGCWPGEVEVDWMMLAGRRAWTVLCANCTPDSAGLPFERALRNHSVHVQASVFARSQPLSPCSRVCVMATCRWRGESTRGRATRKGASDRLTSGAERHRSPLGLAASSSCLPLS